MAEKREWIGLRSGRLEIIGYTDRPNYVLCKCDCGNVKEIRKYSLTGTNPVLSCGCLREERKAQKVIARRESWIGETYGKLRIIDYSEKPGYVICECECGTVKEIWRGSLIQSKNPTRSCGCVSRAIRTENANKRRESLVGQTFGRLLVIGVSERKGYVLCECECGNRKEIIVTSLTQTKKPTRSCGCIQKEISKTLIENGSIFRHEYNEIFQTNFSVLDRTEPNKNNTSGYTGVFFDKSEQKFVAQLSVQHHRYKLGRFKTLEEAVMARKIAEEKYHKPLLEARNELRQERKEKENGNE